MPRDGSNIYHRPPGTDGIPDTTIESARYNVFVADVEQDLNAPRPIVAGGTGATSTTAAMASLGGELANQLVDNYDAFVFVPGSFYSAAGATGAPVAGHAFLGICYSTPAGTITLEARDYSDTTNPHTKYVRTKNAGTWGTWATDSAAAIADLGATKVSKSGDSMSGSLSITGALSATTSVTSPTHILNGTNLITNDGINLLLRTNGGVYAQNIAGASVPFSSSSMSTGPISCSTLNTNGNTLTAGTVNCGAINSSVINSTSDIHGHDIYANRGDGTGVVYFGGSSHYLYWDNINFTLTNNLVVNGVLQTNGDAHLNGTNTFANAITCSSLSCSGGLSVGSFTANPIYVSSGATYLISDGTNLIARTSGWFYVQNTGGAPAGIQCNGVVAADYLQAGGNISTPNEVQAGALRSGTLYLDGSGARYLNWNGAGNVDIVQVANMNQVHGQYMAAGDCNIQGQGLKPGGGFWIDNSDARIKTVKGDYESGLDEILALSPKRFVYKGNDTDKPPSNEVRGLEDKDDGKHKPTLPYRNSTHYQHAVDKTEFIGLLAQEAEAVMPELVNKVAGHIDGKAVKDLRVLNGTPLIYALVNAVKQLAARVEELEARQPARR